MPNLLRKPELQVAAVLAIAVAAGLGTYFATRNGGSHTTTPTVPITGPVGPTGRRVVPITQSGLETLVKELKRSIYWAGPQPDTTYELTQLPHGIIYFRYLPPGTAVGAPIQVLTVGTYAAPGAFSAAKRRAGQSGIVRVPARDGGIAFYSTDAPTSVYVAFPGSDYQIEVSDPSLERARQLVASGKIVPVG